MSSGIPQYLTQTTDSSVPANIAGGGPPHYQFGCRLRAEAKVVGKLLKAGIVNRRVRHFLRHLWKHISNFRTLRRAYEYLRDNCGRGHGEDDVTYDDLTGKEWHKILRELRRALRKGTYRPGRLRVCRMANGRVLRIPTCIDRIVERAIADVLSCLLDISFDDHSYGFRRGRSCHDALAMVKALIEEEDLRICISNDVRKAFDSIPRDALMAIVNQRVPCPELVKVIERIVRRPGTPWGHRDRGVHQGGPLMPLLVNLFFDEVLDRPFRVRRLPVALLRYADDLLIIGRTVNDVREAEQAIRDLLAPQGMKIRGEGEEKRHEVNLRTGKPINYLGLECYVEQGAVNFDISEDAWTALKMDLLDLSRVPERGTVPEEVWAKENGRGWGTLCGFLAYATPTLGVLGRGRDDVVYRTVSLFYNHGVIRPTDLPENPAELGEEHVHWKTTHRVAQWFDEKVSDWCRKQESVRTAYILGREAPLRQYRKSHATEVAPAVGGRVPLDLPERQNQGHASAGHSSPKERAPQTEKAALT